MSRAGTKTSGAMIEIGGKVVPQVDFIRILGRVCSARNLEDASVQDRIAKAWSAFWPHTSM